MNSAMVLNGMERCYIMTTFNTWFTWKDVNKTAAKIAVVNGLELMIYRNTDIEDPAHRLEIWSADDSQEAPYVSYTIKADGSLYLYLKHQDAHKELSKVEDLPLTITSIKQLSNVVKYIAKCLAE